MHLMAETGQGDRRAARLATAFLVSLLCHSLVLVVARGWRFEARPVPPLVVTMLEPGRAGAGAASAVQEGSLSPAAAAPAPAVAVPLPVAKPAAPVRAAAPAPRRASAVASDHATAPAPAATLPFDVGGGVGAGAGLAGSGGAGASGRGSGSASAGDGGGSDGLRAFCASCPAPEYPGRARRQGWQGTVDVELAIARDGAVADARVGRSSGHAVLDDVALAVARRSRFTVPADGGGLRGQLRYRFVLDATAARR